MGVRGLLRLLRRRVGQGTDRGGVLPSPSGTGDRGSSAIEFLFLTPVMFLMIFGAVQYAMYSFAEHVAKAAAQAGARTARAEADVDPAGWEESARQKAYDYIDQLGPGLFTSRPEVDPSQPGPFTVRVDVEGDVPSILPGVDLTVHAASEGPVERFVPDE
jgi:Flp pilus assembly protein TadG